MNPLQMAYLKEANITLKDGQPRSTVFEDVYFNDINGLAETKHVFIEGNQLIERWQQLPNDGTFCIAETGFGSGLNFLATCLAWQNRTKPSQQRLTYISTELYPMSLADMAQAHKLFPEVTTLSQKLQQQYNSFRCGFHHYQITEDITLMLCFGDVNACLKQLSAPVDAWFLDGFSPRKNPEMWCDSLFEEMARLSQHTTTLATYSAASAVRKGLEAAGFNVSKRTGFGPKRDMLTARYIQPLASVTDKQPWWPLPKARHTKKVTIVGAGIAGMSLARSFKKKGFHTTLIDKNPSPMKAGSGNSHAMVMPMLTAKSTPEALFYMRAFEFALKQYNTQCFTPIGVLESVTSQQEKQRKLSLQSLSLSEDLIQFKHNHILYPNAGYLDTNLLAENWLNYVDDWILAEVESIQHHADTWCLQNKHQQTIQQCDLLVIAAGIHSQILTEHQNLSLTAKLGQTNTLKTKTSLNLKHILLNQGYIIPIEENQKDSCYLLGATFDHVTENQWRHDSFAVGNHRTRNTSHWHNYTFFDSLERAVQLGSHTAIRATTPDHLPLCGPVINQNQFAVDYQDLHHGRHWQTYPVAKTVKNLYVLSGLGSRGYTSAPLLAEYLVAIICGQALPLETDLCKMIHPNRFNYRKLKKQQPL